MGFTQGRYHAPLGDLRSNDLAFGDFNGHGDIDIAIPEVPLITILLADGKGGFLIKTLRRTFNEFMKVLETAPVC